MEKYKIIYSPKFWPRINALLSYLKTTWNLKVADDFLKIFTEKVNLLTKNPKIGKPSLKVKGIRSIQITKHNRLYYRATKHVIIIVTLFDNRQNPATNKYD